VSFPIARSRHPVDRDIPISRCQHAVALTLTFNTQNACIAAGTTWTQELNDILNTVSSKSGVTYDSALVSGLKSDPNEGAASMLQSIANNGYNGSSTYGSRMMGMVSVKCMMDNYLK
jgi:hypothetical protein